MFRHNTGTWPERSCSFVSPHLFLQPLHLTTSTMVGPYTTWVLILPKTTFMIKTAGVCSRKKIGCLFSQPLKLATANFQLEHYRPTSRSAATPLPRPHPQWGEGHPSPHPTPSVRGWPSAPSAPRFSRLRNSRRLDPPACAVTNISYFMPWWPALVCAIKRSIPDELTLTCLEWLRACDAQPDGRHRQQLNPR